MSSLTERLPNQRIDDDLRSQVETAIRWLDHLGVRPLTETELDRAHLATYRAIHIGMVRRGDPTTADGGCLAIPSTITPYRANQVHGFFDGSERFAPGVKNAILLNCGGFRWQSGITTIDGSDILIDARYETTFPHASDKEFESPVALAAKVLQVAKEGVGDGESPNTLIINWAFPNIPSRVDQDHKMGFTGVDGAMMSETPAKEWVFRGMVGQPLGYCLARRAYHEGMFISRVYILHDGVGLAVSVPNMSFSYVGGGGSNGINHHPSYLGGEYVNLETGGLQTFPETDLLKYMMSTGILEDDRGIISEHSTGGVFLIKQLAATASYLQDFLGADYSSLFMEHDSTLLSILAEADREKLKEVLKIDLAESGLVVFSEAAKRILHRAGQIMGVINGAMVDFSPVDPNIAVEGSVLLRGYGVMETVKDTVLKLTGKRPVMTEGNGIEGAIKYAFWDMLRYR